MGKLRVLSDQQVCVILAAHGFTNVRQRGSHVVMQRADADGTTMPVPDHREVNMGTLRAVIRQSGVPRQEFEG